MVDFSLHIPSFIAGFTCAIVVIIMMLGIACAVTWGRY